MRVLVDTCVILDALQSRTPFNMAAEKLFMYAANEGFRGYTTAKAVTDLYYLIHRGTHSDQETRKLLGNILKIFEPIDTSAEDCIRALQSNISDYEDAVMVETARRAGIDVIVTRNTGDYNKSPVTVLSPKDFLSFVGILK